MAQRSESTLNTDSLPETIEVGNGLTMTFRSSPTLVVLHATGAPGAERFVVPPHWHPNHGEYHRVLKGRLAITRGGVTQVVTPDDGELYTPAGVVHSMEGFEGEELILEERTDPVDPDKETLFRNMFPDGKVEANPLKVMQMFYQHGDSYPALPGGVHFLEKALVYVLGGCLAPALGYRPKFKNLKSG
ncbi:hypothetical protein BDN70DRAFT_617324 [Pholiota conissans]|uniref:Cupin type-2 domain-containing protein n=1 Tax=Pholiota conissans TaxID=109636 RepID=A0A9P5YJF4_9AGAR|nr:hypothetical protein BDN70DRAFT_617324 [Pholiota conissans]